MNTGGSKAPLIYKSKTNIFKAFLEDFLGHWLYKENMQTYSEGVQQAKEADTEEGGGRGCLRHSKPKTSNHWIYSHITSLQINHKLLELGFTD